MLRRRCERHDIPPARVVTVPFAAARDTTAAVDVSSPRVAGTPSLPRSRGQEGQEGEEVIAMHRPGNPVPGDAHETDRKWRWVELLTTAVRVGVVVLELAREHWPLP